MTLSSRSAGLVRRTAVLCALLLTAMLGVSALKRATPYGLGLANDSAAYVGGARAILAGQGFSRIAGNGEIQPIVHFPPLFSILLAGAAAIGLEMLFAARLLVLLLFGTCILLFAASCYLLSDSTGWAIAGAALFASSGAMLRVNSFALSEPLYLTLNLATYLSMGMFFLQRQRAWLVLAALAAGAATVTRFTGLSLVAASAATLLVVRSDRSRRADVGLFLGVSLLPLLAWSARNLLVAGTSSNRVLVWHPIPWDTLSHGVARLAPWLISLSPPASDASASAFAFLSWATLVGVAIWAVDRMRRGEQSPSTGTAIALLLANSILFYLGGLIVSISLFDASTPLDLRILSPALVPLLMLMVAGLSRLGRSPQPWRRWAALVLGGLALAFSVRGALDAVGNLEVDGQGFASLSWKNSRAVEAVGQLPPEVALYSNRPAGLLLLLGKNSYITPTPTDPSTLLPRQNYVGDMALMRQRILAGQAVLALLHGAGSDGPEDQEWVRQMTQGLPVYAEFNDGTLYGKP